MSRPTSWPNLGTTRARRRARFLGIGEGNRRTSRHSATRARGRRLNDKHRGMIGAIRAFFAPKRRRDDAQHDKEQGKGGAKRRRAASGARAADSTTAHAETGAFDGAGVELAEKRDNGVSTMRVARGVQGTSGAEPIGGADENPAAAKATAKTKAKTKKKQKKQKKEKKQKEQKKEKKVAVDDEREWLPARDDAEDSMDNEHEWLPFAEKRDNGVTTMRVARGEQGASGAEPTSGVDENPAAAATNNKVKTKRKTKRKKTAKCVLCKHAVAKRTVSNFFVGLSHDDVFGSVFDRFSRTKQKRIGTIDPNQQLCQGDGLCKTCASIFEDCVLDWGEWKFGLTANDARKLQILSAHVRDKLKGKLPRVWDVATLARWDHENAEERDGVRIGRFWNRIHRSKERLTHVQNFDDASKNALEYLETCEPRKAERPCRKPHL